jgi:hypothetical protein
VKNSAGYTGTGRTHDLYEASIAVLPIIYIQETNVAIIHNIN